MQLVKRCTCWVILFVSFTSTDSQTETQEDIPGAVALRAANDTYRNYSDGQPVARNVTEPYDWEVEKNLILNATLNRLSNASSVEDLLNAGLVNSNGNPLTAQDISAVYDDTGKMYISTINGGPAENCYCEPRQVSMVVQNNQSGLPADVVLFPRCIKVWRCQGCCSAENVLCQPAAERRTIYYLMKLTIEEDNTEVQFSGYYPLEVMEPTRCHCTCSLSQESCGPRKTFDDRICACRCNSASSNQRCFPPTYFDPESCSCECAERVPCCSGSGYCGMVFNETSCSCEFQEWMYISGSTNQTQGQAREAGYRIAGGTTTRQPSSTPAPVTTTGPLNSDPCATYRCPSSFYRTVTADGRCACARNITRPGRR
ncbi:hypothetical protein BsWGS_27368 [Bradybaena similaris]